MNVCLSDIYYAYYYTQNKATKFAYKIHTTSILGF